MRVQKVFSIFVLISMLFVLFGGGMSTQPALAQDVTPPTADDGSRLDQDVVEGGQAQPPQASQTGGTVMNNTNMTGTDPNQESRWVEVILPASEPPTDDGAVTNANYTERPERSYFIKKSINLVPGPHVLLLEADGDTPSASPINFLLMAYGDMGSVDLFDAQADTPNLGELLPYDVVVTWSNYAYFSPVGIGNVLADYVDAGGKVVNLNFSMGPVALQGRFMTENYTAMKSTTFSPSNSCLGSYNPSHPIMNGISTVCDYWREANTTLTPGSSSIAQWNDGRLFVAAKDDRSVVSINAYVGSLNFQWTGQMPDVVHNAILWLVSQDGCNSVLWNNGPLVTHIGGGYNLANASAVQTILGMNIHGWNNSKLYGYHMADDFTITNPRGWQIEQLTFFAYQTGSSTVSTITGIYYRIWDGPPNDPGSSVIFGDLTTNRLLDTTWSGIYRVTDTALTNNQRPIMANVASAGLHLPPGTYWLDWATNGSLASGPWAPPITILGQTTTGNGLLFDTVNWVTVTDVGQQGFPFLVQGCNEKGAWQQINTNPIPVMDNVLAAYDRKVWSITGYGSPGVAYYTPSTGIWTPVASSAPPFGVNYPRSGCQIGSKVYIYGDTANLAFTGLWSYNMETNAWAPLTPGGVAPIYSGIWAPSWVADPATGRCYMTGGATIPGGGDLKTVFVYSAFSNQWLTPLPNFNTERNFHAAFLFTRPSDAHKLLCVAGGNVLPGTALNTTQCLDFTTSTWNAENADLGMLPLGWWGMGYTQNLTENGGRLWMVNGVDASGLLYDQTWSYSLQRKEWTNAGPLQSGTVYRTSAVTLNGTVYHVGGSIGSFIYSGLSDKYVGFRFSLPLILK